MRTNGIERIKILGLTIDYTETNKNIAPASPIWSEVV